MGHLGRQKWSGGCQTAQNGLGGTKKGRKHLLFAFFRTILGHLGRQKCPKWSGRPQKGRKDLLFAFFRIILGHFERTILGHLGRQKWSGGCQTAQNGLGGTKKGRKHLLFAFFRTILGHLGRQKCPKWWEAPKRPKRPAFCIFSDYIGTF